MIIILYFYVQGKMRRDNALLEYKKKKNVQIHVYNKVAYNGYKFLNALHIYTYMVHAGSACSPAQVVSTSSRY